MHSINSRSVDVLIIGSGAGGAAVAGELRRSGADVTVVEAGPLLIGPPGTHLRNQLAAVGSEVFGDAILRMTNPPGGEGPIDGLPGATVVQAVGGGLNVWTHHCPVPDTLEWPEGVPAEAHDGLIERAQALLRVRTDLRGSNRQARIMAAISSELDSIDPHRPVQPAPVSAEQSGRGLRYWGADVLLDGGEDAGELDLLADHVVRKVITSGSRATGVRVGPRGGGDETQIDASVVIVAAGPIPSAQLLYASEIRPPALGRYLMDHPVVLSRITLLSEFQVAEGETEEVGIWVPATLPDRPRHLQIVESPLTTDGRASDVPFGTAADITTFCGVSPSPDNGLLFDPNRLDSFGLPKVSAVLEHSHEDIEHIAAASSETYRVASRLADLTDGLLVNHLPVGSSFHVHGSVRIGSDPDTSVADPHGRVWDYENLFVVGNGVLGSYTAGNPTLLNVALALRTADAIKSA